MRHRGLLSDRGADAPALRFARYLAAVADGQGVITDLPGLLRGYSLQARVSIRTAYTDLARVIERGLVRQLQAAAPGYAAQYRLCAPAAVVADRMPGLPADLAREICGQLHPSPLTREGTPPSPAGRVQALADIALRYITPGDLAQLLTERISSARDLPGLLSWRLGRVITSARRSRSVRADEDGERYRQMLAERSRRTGPGPQARAELGAARVRMVGVS